MRLRLVLVGPEGPVNLGYIARLAENFDVDELAIVSPQASISDSLRWAAKAWPRLLEAQIFPSLRDALKGADLSICTSDEKSASDLLRTAVTPEEAATIAAGKDLVALVLGRESVGLTRDELAACDLLCTIPTSSRYTALNVSNAAAILLYELFKARRAPSQGFEAASRETLIWSEAYARAIWRKTSRAADDAEVGIAVRKTLAKAQQAEASYILRLLSRACSALECKQLAEELAKTVKEGYTSK